MKQRMTRNPQSVYGRSKAEAEVRLLEVVPECCIARTSWLFGTGGKCFPDTILKLAASRPALDVVNDQRGCPTYSVDLARAIIAIVPQSRQLELCMRRTRGDCSWFEFAQRDREGRGNQNRDAASQHDSRWRDQRRVPRIPCCRRRVCNLMELPCRHGRMHCDDIFRSARVELLLCHCLVECDFVKASRTPPVPVLITSVIPARMFATVQF